MRQTLKGLMSKGLRHLMKHNNGEDLEREQLETRDDSAEIQDDSLKTLDDSVGKSSAKHPKEVIDLITPTLSESQTSTPIPHPSRRYQLFKRRLISRRFIEKSCVGKRLAGRIRMLG